MVIVENVQLESSLCTASFKALWGELFMCTIQNVWSINAGALYSTKELIYIAALAAFRGPLWCKEDVMKQRLQL